ncbi:galactonate dehydratase [Escherichia coli]|nr:galactonate dehydratase [Escherichia coli]
MAQIREAFGNQIEFGLDFHGRVSAPMAKVLIKELEPYRPLFIEEPVLAEQAEYYPNWRHKRIFHWRRVNACSHASILNAC